MKLLTKRLLAVALTIAMTIGMAMSAMALDNIDDAKLKAAGLDPAKCEIVYGWVEINEADADESGSIEAGSSEVIANDGSFTIDFSAYASSEYSKFAMVHNYAGDDQEIVAGTSMTVDSLSPFCLVGEKKDSSAADDDDDDSSSSSSSKKSSSSSKKSPKTGMNDSWMLWLMAAGVFAGASVVAYNKKKG